MRLERLNYNKIKIFLTFDDLFERGLSREDLMSDSLKVHQLFRDMIEEASSELGFEADGPIAVEVYSLQAQGMVIIVTKGSTEQEEDEEFLDDYIEMQVTLDESNDIFYEFHTFEDVIQLSSRLFELSILGGRLYSFENLFYLLIEEDSKLITENLIAILAEFGNPATITKHRVHEYGKIIFQEYAMKDIYHYFIRR
ncbi:genetic competence negative regulator [Fredinandcohnia quinoae]|uniref:Adapter protein MecA n=1 Tax=Fredinandcohnia quinoae TaxID=2918902 RepID=A0AAW5E5A1_9BACI|nr:genetic competence negative regulator [Fredinandcohnia sp. SECRCQ15]MCH1624775.1 genetic competence negative regulator [Fredinandcohnia sp. SECRCQ15]